MIRKKIEEISLRGRIAYAIMCIEAYLKSEYPKKNWMILSQKMWEATNSPLEEWFFSFGEFIPEFVFEFPDYESSDFEYISKVDYYALIELYNGVNSDVNELLMLLDTIVQLYLYTAIPGIEKDSIDVLKKIEKYLISRKVMLPNLQKISFSKFNESNGWGNYFDGTKLSIILSP